MRHILGVIEKFDVYGIYHTKGRRCGLGKLLPYETLNPDYKKLIDRYESVLRRSGLRDTTITSEIHAAVSFLKNLNDSGVYSLSLVNEDDVHKMFYDGNKTLRGYDFSFGVRRFMLKMERVIGKEHCHRIIAYLPKSVKVHKPYHAMTDEEFKKLESALQDKTNGISLRDRAIVTLALYTGLRNSDIVSLKFENIDWNNNKISLVQSKTLTPLTLPLRPIIGNALYDYIKEERPNSKSPYIFLSTRKGRLKMSPTGLPVLSYKVFNVAGIRINGEKKGLHLLRHRVATSLINNGHESPIVMSVLGHTVPLAVDYYLESDYKKLKECGLDINQWYIRKEVLL
jgi:integrase